MMLALSDPRSGRYSFFSEFAAVPRSRYRCVQGAATTVLMFRSGAYMYSTAMGMAWQVPIHTLIR
jgi:hypothetical protein